MKDLKNMHKVQPRKEKTDKFEYIKITNIINGHRVSVGNNSKAVEVNDGDDPQQCPRTVLFNKVKIVNFMFCVF